MDGTQDSLRATLHGWNDDGRLYLWGGAAAAAISLLFVSLFGLVAVYCGYKIYDDQPVPAVVIGGIGGVGVLFWVYYLTTL